MDDTLLNSEKQVTKENMDAISEALAAGHKIVFNTGRPLSGFLPILKELGRKLTSTISKTKTTCIFINQLREKIGVMFGNPETTTGGNAQIGRAHV